MGYDPKRFRLSEDLEIWAQVGVGALVLLTFFLLFFEARAHQRARGLLFLSGVLGTLLLAFAVLRPARLTTKGNEVPGLSILLVDASHRLELPGDEGQST